MTSQWERLLKNQGTWLGSFTRFNPDGKLISDIPTTVSLKGGNGGDTMRQTVRKMPADQPPEEQVYEYNSLGRSVLFFEDGAFSQGSIQWAPFSQFGAELGFIQGDRRLRLVQLYNRDRALEHITLIREQQEGTNAPERSPLTVEQLYGTWEGEAVTIYPDLQPQSVMPTQLTIKAIDNHQIQQSITMGDRAPFTSTGILDGHCIRFGRAQTLQVTLLPGGASSNCPVAIQPRQPFFLEAGWLWERDRRQRIIRSYNAQGAWTSLTLVS
ncbi:MAG: DUF3598 family protein, partial [Cyanobacteria bacterium P01_C01_bin.73]